MKTLRLLFLAMLVGVPNIFAQYAIDWHTIDGGGGSSAGGA
jgi:hypothetical protein